MGAMSVCFEEVLFAGCGALPPARWCRGKPKSTRELMDFMALRGMPMCALEASNFLYAFGGAEQDTRDFNRILNAPDPRVANEQALGRMYAQLVHW